MKWVAFKPRCQVFIADAQFDGNAEQLSVRYRRCILITAAVQDCQERVEEKVVKYAPILIGLGIGVAMIQV